MEIEWPCDSKEYIGVFDNSRKIGQGAFSTVYRGLCISKNVDVAIKVMDLESITSSFEDILLEVQTMKLSNHENILQCHASFVYDTKLWVVLQYMDKGSCLRIMNISKREGFGEGFNEDWIGYIIKETLKGLHYIHNAGYIHRDIKPGNILLNQYGEVRLADFGVAGWIFSRGQRHENVRTFVGTLSYMSPEIMEQTQGYDQKADIWSLGITGLELAKGFAPYAKFAPMRILVMTIEEDSPSLKCYKDNLQPSGEPFSKLFDDFCAKCLQKDPKLRSSADELLKHKFFRGRNKESFLDQLLCKIPSMDVPSGKESTSSSSSSSSSVVSHKSHIPSGTGSDQGSKKSDVYVAGTTWIFDDENLPASERMSSVYRRSTSLVSGSGFDQVTTSGTSATSSSVTASAIRTTTTTSRSKTLSISVLKGSSSSGQAVVRISSHNTPVEGIDEFLDDFEVESASMKTKTGDESTPSKETTRTNETESFLDEIQSIIGKDSLA